MRRKKAAVLLIFLLILSIFLQMRLVQDWSGATVYARENEAYIFMADSHSGYHFPYIAFPFIAFFEFFGAVKEANDERSAAVVLHITPNSIEREIFVPADLNHATPFYITPFEDGLYGQCAGGTLCKWTGKSFEPATIEQQHKIGGIEHLARGDTRNESVNGWVIGHSERPGGQFKAQVGKDIVISMQNHDKEDSIYKWVSADLLRSGQPAEHVYNVDGRNSRLVTKATYNRIFSTAQVSP